MSENPMPSSSEYGGANLKVIILIIFCLTVVAALSIPFFDNLNVKSLRSEAKVMLAYIATLESAYKADSGHYAYFSDFYGSQIGGVDNCERPEGAEELGLILKNCAKQPQAGGLRYSYRVLETNETDVESFRAEAVSGSNLSNDSFVCLGTTNKDVWFTGPDRVLHNSVSCK